MNQLVCSTALVFLLILNGFGSLAQPVTNHDPLPQPNIPKPAASAAFSDPMFGTLVMRLTDSKAVGLEGCFPEYSKRQAWNADETLLLLRTGNGEALLYDGQTYQFKKVLPLVGGEDVMWHPTDPFIIWYNPDNALHAYHIQTDTDTILVTFSNYTFANTRGEGNFSNDGRYYAFAGQLYDEQTKEVAFKDLVLFDVLNKKEVSRLALPSTLSDFDWVSVSPKGDFVVVDYGGSSTEPFHGVEVYDTQFHRLWQKPLGYGHSDLGVDENGDQVLVIDYYNEATNRTEIKKVRLSDGQETTLLTLFWAFYTHISCRNTLQPGWCLISTYDGEGRLTDDTASWLPFEDEIFLLKLDGSQQVHRLTHHHSRRYSPETPDSDHSVYFAEPHATLSRKGDRVLFGSNWRENIQLVVSVDAYLVDLRSTTPPPEDFSISLTPASMSLKRGESGNFTVNINRQNGFSGPVTVTAANVKELKLKLTPKEAVTTGNQLSFKVKAKSSTPSGENSLILTARDGAGRLRTVSLNIVVN